MGLLKLFSPALAGPKGNAAGLARFEKIVRAIPDDVAARLGPFLYALTEKLSPKEEHALVRATGLTRADEALWKNLGARAKKLETALRSVRIRKPSQVYHVVSAAPGDEVLFLLYHSALRPVQDRLRTIFRNTCPPCRKSRPRNGPRWKASPARRNMRRPGTPSSRSGWIAGPRSRRKKRRRPRRPPKR